MAVSFRSSSSVIVGTRTNTVLTAPAGIVNNDILVIIFYIENNIAFTVPSGFAAFTGFPVNFPVQAADMGAYWKRASGEAGNYTLTHASAISAAYIGAYPGARLTGSPQHVNPSINTGNADTTIEATTVTTTVPGSMVIFASTNWDLYPAAPSAPPGTTPTFTQRLNPGTTNIMHVCDGALTPAGATGSKIVSGGPATNDWVASLITLEAQASSLAGAIAAVYEEMMS